MSGSREDLIRRLVDDLRPVARPGCIGRMLSLWLVFAFAYSGFVVLATGPLREGALGNFVSRIPFALETLLAVTVIVFLAHAALRSSLPGAASLERQLAWPSVLAAAWAGVYLIGIWYPAHPVSTLGHRDHCFWQSVLFTLPSFVFMLVLARRLFPLRARLTGAFAGAAAAAVPGAMMQFACMYVPTHILTHHLSPVALATTVGALVGPVVLVRRRTEPRSRDGTER